MKIALVNPPWVFDGSIYFGCREGHLPLEYGYAKALLEQAGHDVLLVDAQLGVTWATDGEIVATPHLDDAFVRSALADFGPRMTAITTAPSYLFWRCAPPELRVPMRTLDAVRDVAGMIVVVGPHASTTPRATLRKLRADAAIVGECEDVLVTLAARPEPEAILPSVLRLDEHGALTGNGEKHSSDMKSLPVLAWPGEVLHRHSHHHHRFERVPEGPGAELEASRGCPYHCTFCAKDNFRNAFRKRPTEVVLSEIDGLVAEGARYVYFIDEIFVPDQKLLEGLRKRRARGLMFGVQMRIDNWTPALLDLLGEAGCVSIEAGLESISDRGRSLLAKHCKLSTEELTELLIHAKKRVPFVQANLLDATCDKKKDVDAWRKRLQDHGVWSNEPVPLFPYPGSPEYALRFGACEDDAWERAHAHYLQEYDAFSDIQESRPRSLDELERGVAHG
ncbi:MAG: radical protein [Myxococcaceae bacterium]|nr:radical protein [Myxococcaceae bacterium]MEA2752221.1 anaerobic magnesium-protoporphyrin monomethyl ester cyclase [Myxococcales bacterium]